MNNYDGYTESQAMTDARIARRAEWNKQVTIRDEMVAECQPMLDTLLNEFQWIDETITGLPHAEVIAEMVIAQHDEQAQQFEESAEIIAAWGDPAQLVNSTTNCRTPYVIDDDFHPSSEWDFTPYPKDMPVIDMDTVQEVKF